MSVEDASKGAVAAGLTQREREREYMKLYNRFVYV